MEEVVIARPKEGNANFEELFLGVPAEEEEEHDEYGFMRDVQNAPAIGLDIPGFEQMQSSSYPTDPSANPFPSALPPPGQQIPEGPSLSSEVLVNLQRRAEFLTNPVIMFVAEVATSAGSSLAQMMANPSLPLVNTNAPTIQALLTGSQIPRDLLLVVLAKVLLDNPRASIVAQQPQPSSLGTAATGSKTAESVPLEKSDSLSPRKKQPDPSDTPFPSPGQTNAMIGETIRDYISTLDQISIGPFGRAAAAPVVAGVPAGAAQGPDPQRILYDALIDIQKGSNVLEWTWSQMPEQSGMALVKPEVSTIIQSCFESVRALSPSHRSIQLWHLMTGPLVRHKFARLVGSLLNTVPGDVQYPNYNSARRNGAVTGSRVSSGIVLQTRHSRVYAALLNWFKNVSYRESEEWIQVNRRLQDADTTIANARNELGLARANLIQAAEIVWGKYLSFETREMAADLWSLEFQPANQQEFIGTADLRREIRLKLATARPLPPNGIDSIAGSDVFYLTPLIERRNAPGQGRLYVANRDFTRQDISFPVLGTDNDRLIKILREGKAATENISRRLVYATGGPGDGSRALLNLHGAIEIMLTALFSIRRVIDQVLTDKRLYASFDEMRKKELVHREPSIRDGDDGGMYGRQPLKNFLY